MAEAANKVAIITGAGSGIGRGTAEVFAARGHSVVLGDVREDYLTRTVAGLQGEGHIALAGDVSDEGFSRSLVATAVDQFGALDVFIGCAGVMFFKDITDVTVEEFDRLHAVNVRGMFLGCKHALAQMTRQRSGSIVLVTSGSAYRGQEFEGVSSFAYNMTKAAVRQLATSMATRYAADGIRVNAIAPGVIRTHGLRHFMSDLTDHAEEELFADIARAAAPMGRYGLPEEVGRAIFFLASDDASYITGATLFADGGLMAR